VEALLDACTVSYFFQSGQKELLRHAAGVMQLHLVKQVVEELEKEKTWGPGFKKLFEDLSDGGLCEIHSLMLGSEEARLFNALRKDRTSTKDLGERASIALAAHRPDLVFVTEDFGAVRLALVHLPGFPSRVTRTAGWLRALAERGVKFDRGALARWAACTWARPRKNEEPAVPYWWNSWVDAQAEGVPPAVS
jgi:hypothetical protein